MDNDTLKKIIIAATCATAGYLIAKKVNEFKSNEDVESLKKLIEEIKKMVDT